MTQEFQDWLLKDSQKSFVNLAKNVGKKIVVYFNKVVEDNLPAIDAKISGVLESVKDFSHIVVSGTVVNFVSDRQIISKITLADTMESLYDKTLIVYKGMKVRANLAKYQFGIMGHSPIKQRTPNLTQNQEFQTA